MLDPTKHGLVLTWLYLGLLTNKKAVQKTFEFGLVHELASKFLTNAKSEHVQPVLSKFFSVSSLYTDYLLTE